MPSLTNPSAGFIVTANAKPVVDAEGPMLGVDFLDGYRLSSIANALQTRHDWDVASTMRLQMDQKALAWQEMREIILSAPILNPKVDQALTLLSNWDGNVAADSPAAAVYELFLAEMIQRVAIAKAPGSWRWIIGAGLSPLESSNFGCYRRTSHLVSLLRTQPLNWFPHSWLHEIALVLDSVIQFLSGKFGSSERSWSWGRIRPLVLRHPLSLSKGLMGKALAAIFNLGPIPWGGDSDVINQAAALPLEPLTPSDNIPSLRAVFDVGAWHNSRFVLPGGQSGNPLSPHYRDLFELWQRGEGVPIAFSDSEVQAATVQTLQLTVIS
jgi:penicillin amidase